MMNEAGAKRLHSNQVESAKMGEGFFMQMFSILMTQQKGILEIENENIELVAKVSRNITKLAVLWAFVGILNLYYAGMAIWRNYAVPRTEIHIITTPSQARAEPSIRHDILPGTSQQVSLPFTLNSPRGNSPRGNNWGCGEQH